MAQYPDSFAHMLAAWNEAESSKVRGHLERALTQDVLFLDPSIDVKGIDGFEANVHEVHERIPGAVYSRAGGVDTHHHLYRYTWAIHRDGELVLPGFDVVELDASGLIARVLGFFGPLPNLQGASTNEA
jgi:hypothetical protein